VIGALDSRYSFISALDSPVLALTPLKLVKERMAFIIKKKRYKFQVDLVLNEHTNVSFSRAILFAKIRQLDGGNYSAYSNRLEVDNHTVKYDANFSFPCKMNANSTTGVLDSAKVRISIRKEEKGGRNFRKIGFVDIDLAEYAGAGPSTQRYILQAYDSSHRLDNSMLQLTLNITLREGDTIFQRPLTRQQPILLPGEDTAGRPQAPDSTEDPVTGLPAALNTKNNLTMSDVTDMNHTRNSSNTSQPSQTGSAGYCSQGSHQEHSRQSSGESGHARNLSAGSNDTGIYGSMEKEKRRKKLDAGRVDAEEVINEIMENVQVEPIHHEGSGLQLYMVDKPRVLNTDYQPIVIETTKR